MRSVLFGGRVVNPGATLVARSISVCIVLAVPPLLVFGTSLQVLAIPTPIPRHPVQSVRLVPPPRIMQKRAQPYVSELKTDPAPARTALPPREALRSASPQSAPSIAGSPSHLHLDVAKLTQNLAWYAARGSDGSYNIRVSLNEAWVSFVHQVGGEFAFSTHLPEPGEQVWTLRSGENQVRLARVLPGTEVRPLVGTVPFLMTHSEEAARKVPRPVNYLGMYVVYPGEALNAVRNWLSEELRASGYNPADIDWVRIQYAFGPKGSIACELTAVESSQPGRPQQTRLAGELN
jgi:hypothetical protein